MSASLSAIASVAASSNAGARTAGELGGVAGERGQERVFEWLRGGVAKV